MHDVSVIGGGLAGLISAIHLRKAGFSVQLFERHSFPRNKVCGEYISNEVWPYLESLDLNIQALQPKLIRHFLFTSPYGKAVKTPLGLGGFSVSRHALDHHLYQLAQALGVDVHTETSIQHLQFEQDHFSLQTTDKQGFASRVAIGSHGKRSGLDRTLKRSFFEKRVDYVGVKAYYRGPFQDDLVALHNFPGGYCGLSKVENGLINVAYLTKAHLLKQYGNLDALEEKGLGQNPHLKRFFQEYERVTPQRLVISNISFDKKDLINQHVLMTGDAAGMIPPLAGNGMAMAIHAAKIVSEHSERFLRGEINRPELEAAYGKDWNRAFRYRLFWGRTIQRLMGEKSMEMAVRALKVLPGALPLVVRQTHGKVLTP
ncbi:MAG: NAD(P)/FAD-dependent oxidoreductase [Bacteroidota bacterium]